MLPVLQRLAELEGFRSQSAFQLHSGVFDWGWFSSVHLRNGRACSIFFDFPYCFCDCTKGAFGDLSLYFILLSFFKMMREGWETRPHLKIVQDFILRNCVDGRLLHLSTLSSYRLGCPHFRGCQATVSGGKPEIPGTSGEKMETKSQRSGQVGWLT